jgi:hypothetical protein
MSTIYYRPDGFARCIVQTLGAPIQGDSATDTFTADAAHGLAVGDTVAATALGGGTGLALLTRYFVVNVADATHLKVSATRGGAAIALGTTTDMSLVPLIETRLYLANKASADASTAEKKWEGDDSEIIKKSITGMSVQIDVDAVNASADALIFGKTAITGALPGGITSGTGFGGGNHRRGVSAGVRLEASAVKVTDGVESNVTWCRWYPQGTLNPMKPGELGTSAKLGVTSYSYTPVRVTKDLLGVAIAGVSTDGEFYVEGELA